MVNLKKALKETIKEIVDLRDSVRDFFKIKAAMQRTESAIHHYRSLYHRERTHEKKQAYSEHVAQLERLHHALKEKLHDTKDDIRDSLRRIDRELAE